MNYEEGKEYKKFCVEQSKKLDDLIAKIDCNKVDERKLDITMKVTKLFYKDSMEAEDKYYTMNHICHIPYNLKKICEVQDWFKDEEE